MAKPSYTEVCLWLVYGDMGKKGNNQCRESGDTEKRISDLLSLNTLVNTLSSSLSTEDIIEKAVTGIREILGADLVFMLELDSRRKRLILTKSCPDMPKKDNDNFLKHPLEECLCGKAATELKEIYSEDIHSDSRCTRTECKEAGFRSFAAIPLRSEAGLRGVIGIASKNKKNYGNERDLIERISNQLSLVLKNSENYEKLQKEKDRRKKAQSKLKENERFLKSIFRSIQDGISVLNTDLTIRYTNKVMEVWYSDNLPLQGKYCYECYHNKKKPCNTCPTQRCIKTKQTEMNIVKGLPESEVEWIELYSYPIIEESTGEVSGVVEFVRDITQRKKAEESIANEKERLLVTLRSIGDAVITTDIDGNVVLMNPIAEKLTGWSQKEAVGKPLSSVFKIINEISREPCESPVEKALNSGSIVELANHTILISKNGSERFIADSGAPIKDSDSITIGVVLVFRDITEKNRLLRAAQKNQRLESLGILAGGIAHDFNNILTGLFGYIDLAANESQNSDPDPSKLREFLEESLTPLERARNLTQQLLTFSKGGNPVKKEGDIIPAIKKTVNFALSGSKVTSSFDIQEDLWNGDFDRNQIEQVMENLVINAAQSMPTGGRILVKAENVHLKSKCVSNLSKGKYLKITVSDSGTGISKEVIPHIFDPFFTTKSQGQGLGLSTSHSIISKHGGDISVESEKGKGTTFTIYLPAATRDPCSKDRPKDSEKKKTKRNTFLIMEDEFVVQKVMKSMLESLGYTVLTTQQGQEAIDLFKKEKKQGNTIDGMLFDLTIPGGMGGREAVSGIRKIDKEIPVFVASGYTSDDIMANPEKYGFTASIKKPFKISELSEMLSRYL